MVHALKEAHRVLARQGIMVDVRPLSVDVPLEIVDSGVRESAGMIDTSPGIEADQAADRAIETVLSEGLYRDVSQDLFYYNYYWNTYRDMKVDLIEYWKDDVIITNRVLKHAQKLKRRHPHSQIFVGVQMKLGKYSKAL
jgi:hypothetical protein